MTEKPQAKIHQKIGTDINLAYEARFRSEFAGLVKTTEQARPFVYQPL